MAAKDFLGGIFKLPELEELKGVFGRFNYVPRNDKIPNLDVKVYSVLSKLGGAIGGISLEKIHQGAKGIGYKLGILKGRVSQEALSSSNVSKEGREWYNRKEEVIEEAKQEKAKIDGEKAFYFKRG